MAVTIKGFASDWSVPEPAKATLGALYATREAAASATPARYKLGPLWGALGMAATAPVGIVAVGSSTVAGTGASPVANRWVNKLTAHLQRTFPNGATESAPTTVSATRITTPGVHMYNGGIGATTSANYLTDASVATIGALAPRAILHMVGSNDVYNSMPAETYRANLVAWLDKLDATVPGPYTNVLFHAHPRISISQSLYDSYREVLRDLAETRSNCVFVEVEKHFRAAGVPDNDTLDLLGPDNVHLTNAGHDLLYRIAAAGLGVPVVGAATTSAPAPDPAPATVHLSSVLATDAFTGADIDPIVGRTFDNALGGSNALAWSAAAGQRVAISGGRMVLGAGAGASGSTFFAGTQMSIPDYEISAVLAAAPAGADLNFSARRADDTTGSPNDVRLTFNIATGLVTLRWRVSGTFTVKATLGSYAVGKRYGLRVVGTNIYAVIDGVVAATVTDNPVAGPGWVGVVGTSTTTGWALDNVVVSAALT